MIGFILKLMLTKGLTMKRWNNFPRIEEVSHLDNVGYVLHIALFLAHLEEQNGNKIDKEFLIKRIIFNSLSPLILSDINSGTRDYIMKVDRYVFNQLEEKAFEFILNKEAPSILKNDLKETLKNTDKKLELSIIEASKKYAGYRECLINKKVFYQMYEVPLEQIEEYLSEKRKTLKSLDILLSNNEYIKYLSHIRRLNHSMRWSGQTRIFPISVMSHLALITFIVYVIGTLENIEKKHLNIEDLMLRTIYHDIPEAITGDIITPTKKAVEGFEEVLEKVEVEMMNDYIFSFVDEKYKEEVYDFMLSPFEGLEGGIAKQADIFSALFEAKIERNYGGKNFSEMYKNIKKKVNSFGTKSSLYMITEVMDSFDEKIDDINLNEVS